MTQKNDIDLEKTIIGEILYSEKDEQLEYLSLLGTKDFQNEKWKYIFGKCCEIALSKKKIDTTILYEYAKEQFSPHDVIDLLINIQTSREIFQHICQLKELTFKRELIDSLKVNSKLLKDAITIDELEEAKNKIISGLSGISANDNSSFVKFDEVRDLLLHNIEHNTTIEGYSWGINMLNAFTSGINTKRLYVIGGLKKGGKSRFIINLKREMIEQKVKVMFQSLEMPEYEVVKLMHSNFAQIDDLKLRAKSFLSGMERSILNSLTFEKEYFDIECKAGLNKNAVLGRLRKYSKLGFKVVIIDYLQRIKHDRNKQAQELEQISNEIADAAREYDLAIILLSQLQNLAENEPPTVGHLKGSGGIAESADCIILFDNLYRRTKDETKKGQIDLYVEQRYGDSGKVSVMANLGICRFFDIDVKHNTQYSEQEINDF